MNVGTTTSMGMSDMISATATASAMMTATTDFTPGRMDSKGRYVPTSSEMTAYQAARIPWADQVKYGYYTLEFLSGLLAFYTILNAFWRYRVRYGISSTLYIRLSAISRLFTYPQIPRYQDYLSWLWIFGPLGPNLILFAGLVFASCFTFINEYYYYPPFYGSAPLYLRSEWIAMATLPFVYVLGSKRNIISVLTGVSHEKLQVLHQGAAFNFTYMSLVHTIAACIRAIRERGLGGTLKVNEVYVSGFVALAPLLVLFIGALPPFRRPFYETFYWIHIVMALFFAGAMFWHGYQTLDSDAYMIATIVLFLSSITWRFIMTILNNPVFHRAKAELIDDETLKLVIPTIFIDWSAGQHVFLRFISVQPFDSHPFTISSMPTPSCHDQNRSRNQERTMVFLLKPLSGFTGTLFDKVQNGEVDFRVLVDGPYGGVGNDLRAFDSVMICTGGTGITWALSVLEDLAWNGKKGQEINLVWAVRKLSATKWFENELTFIQSQFPHINIQLNVTSDSSEKAKQHLTATSSSTDNGTPITEKDITLEEKHNLSILSGRPDLQRLIQQRASSTQGALAIATCGPASFLADCANAATKAQIGILTGRYPDLTEVYLKSESYAW
ncbi:uncharacterized protein IL334_006869 [Kwoniella shivajii]|uniref:ferric-chelate reductase (NADPH) n=1 Tax=Kwoniella shivajii TaxID=564305 RepID=A0ABZ1D764_9TREE|nr:hypothetical protein IL334_006869 [Kwoniella shivajii]